MLTSSLPHFVPSSYLDGACCLLSAPHTPPVAAPALSPQLAARGLTPAEQRVLALMLRGLSNKEISSVLGRAEPTIKHQVSAVLVKFGVPSRARIQALLRA